MPSWPTTSVWLCQTWHIYGPAGLAGAVEVHTNWRVVRLDDGAQKRRRVKVSKEGIRSERHLLGLTVHPWEILAS